MVSNYRRKKRNTIFLLLILFLLLVSCFQKKIEIIYYKESSGHVFYKHKVSLDVLPDDLSRITEIVINKKQYSIINTSPSLKKEFEKSGKIKIIIDSH